MEHHQSRTLPMVEGAFMACIAAILALAGIYIPVLSIFTNFVWTVPIILIIVRYGPVRGLTAFAVAILIIIVTYSPLAAFFHLIQFGGLTMTYGYAFHKKISPGLTLAAGAVVAAISMVLGFYLAFLVTGLNTINMAEQMKEAIEPSMELLRGMNYFARTGLSEEAVRAQFITAIDLMNLVIPGLLALSGLTTAVINYVAAQKILNRLKTPIPSLPPFRFWRLPWWTVWGLLVGLGFNILGSYTGNPVYSNLAANILLIYYFILTFMGLAVANYYINERLQGALMYRVMLFAFLFLFMQLVTMILAIVGLFDMLFDYRRLGREK